MKLLLPFSPATLGRRRTTKPQWQLNSLSTRCAARACHAQFSAQTFRTVRKPLQEIAERPASDMLERAVARPSNPPCICTRCEAFDDASVASVLAGPLREAVHG